MIAKLTKQACFSSYCSKYLETHNDLNINKMYLAEKKSSYAIHTHEKLTVY